MSTICGYLDGKKIQLASFTYDTYGNLDLKTDSRGKTTDYDHNSRNLVETIKYPGPEGYTATFQYNLNDKLVERVVPVRPGVARKDVFTLDILGNVTTVEVERTGPSDTVETKTKYDDGERVTDVWDEEGRRTSFEWSDRHLLTKVAFAPDFPSIKGEIVYKYDHEGRRTTVVDPRGKEWKSKYDGHGRVLQDIDPEGHYLEIGYSGTLVTLETRYAFGDSTIYRQVGTLDVVRRASAPEHGSDPGEEGARWRSDRRRMEHNELRVRPCRARQEGDR